MPALADKVVYRIKTQTEDGSYNQAKINMWGEKANASSGWILLKGDVYRRVGGAPLTIESVSGTYRYEPFSNGYHQGTIQAVGDGSLIWTNEAGISWTLRPDFATGVLRKDPGSPYQDKPGGQQFDVLRGPGGEVTGFRFQNDVYHRR